MEYRLKVLAGLIDITGDLKKESNSYSFNYEISIDDTGTIIGYDEDGPKLFILLPEGGE